MAQFPSLPLFTDAFLSDTSHLDAAETGAYLMLLMAAWRSPQCALPNDDARLARMARCDSRTWKRVAPAVLAFWTIGEDGLLRQKRLTKEREFCNTSRAKKVAAAEAANEAKALKRQRSARADGGAPGDAHGTQPTPTPIPIKEEGTSLASLANRAGESDGEFRLTEPPSPTKPNRPPDWPADYREQFWAAYPHKVGKPKALAKLDGIARRSKTPWADLMAGLRRYIANKPPDRQWCNPETWLNQERWSDQPAGSCQVAAIAPAVTARDPATVSEREWEHHGTQLIYGHGWLDALGPAPGEPGCAMPEPMQSRIAEKARQVGQLPRRRRPA